MKKGRTLEVVLAQQDFRSVQVKFKIERKQRTPPDAKKRKEDECWSFPNASNLDEIQKHEMKLPEFSDDQVYFIATDIDGGVRGNKGEEFVLTELCARTRAAYVDESGRYISDAEAAVKYPNEKDRQKAVGWNGRQKCTMRIDGEGAYRCVEELYAAIEWGEVRLNAHNGTSESKRQKDDFVEFLLELPQRNYGEIYQGERKIKVRQLKRILNHLQ